MAKRAHSKKTVGKRKVRVRPVVAPELDLSTEQVASASVPGTMRILKDSFYLIKSNLKAISFMVLAYLLALTILAGVVIDSQTIADIRNEFSNPIVGSGIAYVELIGAAGTSTDTAGDAYRTILLVLLSLALIWVYRQTSLGSTLRARDAWYNGMTPLIPFLLLIGLFAIQMIPLVIGWFLYSLAASSTALQILEHAFWITAALILSFFSIRLASTTVLSLYAVTRDGARPLQTYRTVKQILAGRRWRALGKLLLLPVLLIIGMALILVPIILVVPVIAPLMLHIVGAVAIVFAHAYYFTVYRGFIAHD